MASRLNPYLNFAGGTREAMEFYRSALGGHLDVSTFGDFGMEGAPPDGVMHAQLTTDAGYVVMAADLPPGMPAEAAANGTISISGDATEADALRGYFAALADGGEVSVPLAPAPWGDEFGMVRDRFGVQWLVDITPSGD